MELWCKLRQRCYDNLKMGIKSSWTACQVGSILWQSGACLEACIDKPCTLAVIPYLSWSLLFSNFVCCSFLVIFFSCLSEWWSDKRKKPWEQQGCYFQSDLKDNCKANALKLTKEHMNATPCHNFLPWSICLSVQAKGMSRHYSWRNDRNERNSGAFPSRNSQLSEWEGRSLIYWERWIKTQMDKQSRQF